jgi:hypothetical protein
MLLFLGKKEHANYICCYDTCGGKEATKKVVAMWETTHWLFFCFIVATHVKELVKIIIFSSDHVQRKQLFFFGCDAHVKGSC